MRFNKNFEVIRMKETSDLMGGYEIVEATIGNISGFVSPVSVEKMLKEHGVVSNRAMKIFTKDTIPDDHIQLKYADKIKNKFTYYEIIQIADYGKYRMLLVQVI